MRKTHRKKCIGTAAALLLAVTALLAGCGGTETASSAEAHTPAVSESSGAEETSASDPFGAGEASVSGETPATSSAPGGKKTSGGYKAPAFRDAKFDASAAEGNDEAQVDMSSVGEGYVGLHCSTDAKIKFQVVKDDLTVTYSVENNKDQIFPLQSGSGHYVFKVMKNIQEKKYAELYRCEADVTIADEFDPFLRPNQYTDYAKTSACVKKAGELAEAASDKEDFIAKVYDFVCSSITYDYELAETVQSGYLPEPDRTLKEKKGICFDYASLAAAMMRSQGIPTKIIFGYVAPDDVYHAWNKFYTEKGGWKLVEFKVAGKDWNRIDLTFYANSADAKFIGDGSNYMEAYEF